MASTAADDALRLLAGVGDTALSALAGRPARLRVALSAGSALGGRVERLSLRFDGIEVSGLVLAHLAIDARQVTVVPGWPPRLRAGPVLLDATVAQDALDRWLRRAGVPLRLRLRADGLATRVGMGGIRFAEVRAGVEVDRGRLVVTPRGAEVFRLGLGTPAVRVPLPLPPLPRGTQLVELSLTDGEARIGVRIPLVDEPVDVERVRLLGRLLAAHDRRRVPPEVEPGR